MKSTERNDLLISWLTISIAFSILLSRPFLNILDFVIVFPISLTTVGAGFIFHELAHRTVAKKFGAHAEYRAWKAGLVFAILSSFIGFIFAAPGAVYIYGNINRKQNGLISLAGPATNIAVGLIFALVAMARLSDITNLTGNIGLQINMFLAMFNLIPFGPLDGGKVFVWNPAVWGVAIAISFIGWFFLPGFL